MMYYRAAKIWLQTLFAKSSLFKHTQIKGMIVQEELVSFFNNFRLQVNQEFIDCFLDYYRERKLQLESNLMTSEEFDYFEKFAQAKLTFNSQLNPQQVKGISIFVAQQLNKLLENMKTLRKHFLNNINLSSNSHQQVSQQLLTILEEKKKLRSLFLFFVKLTSIAIEFTVCGSNAAYLLNKIKFNFNGEDLSGIILQNTDISGGEFVGVNFSDSKLDHVNISSCNFNSACLVNIVWRNIFCQEQGKVKIHDKGISKIKFKKQEGVLISCGKDRMIRIYDCNTQKKSCLTNYTNSIQFNQIAVANQTAILASSGDDFQITVWCLYSKSKLHITQAHAAFINALVFSSNDALLASGSDDRTIKIWQVETLALKVLHHFKGHNKKIFSLEFSSDANQLLSCSLDQTIRIWDLTSGIEIKRVLIQQDNEAITLAISPNFQILASGSTNSIVQIRTIPELTISQSLSIIGKQPDELCFSPEGTMLASLSSSNRIKIWKVGSILELHSEIYSNQMVTSLAFKDDMSLFTGEVDGAISGFRLDLGQDMRAHNNDFLQIGLIQFSEKSAELFVSNQKSIIAIDCQRGIIQKKQPTSIRMIRQSFIIKNEQQLVTWSDDSALSFWDLDTGLLLKEIKYQLKEGFITLSPDRQQFTILSVDQLIHCEMNTGRTLKRNKIEQFGSSLKYHPNGQYIIVIVDSVLLKVYDCKSLKIIRSLNSRNLDTIVFDTLVTPDGTTLIETNENSVNFFNLKTGVLIKEIFPFEKGPVSSIQISCDGKWIAMSGIYEYIEIYSLKVGEIILKLNVGLVTYFSIFFSPDSQVLATKEKNEQVTYWNLNKEYWHQNHKFIKEQIKNLIISTDGLVLVFIEFYDKMKFWDVSKSQYFKKDQYDSKIQQWEIDIKSKVQFYQHFGNVDDLGIYKTSISKTFRPNCLQCKHAILRNTSILTNQNHDLAQLFN